MNIFLWLFGMTEPDPNKFKRKTNKINKDNFNYSICNKVGNRFLMR